MDHTYSIQEVAAKLNLSDKTLRRWEEAGRFRSNRTLGNQRRYSLEDIQILDAIKHGTINSQSELLSLEQAANFCGVSKATFTRWEDDGKIHPLITSGNTYYPRKRLAAKLQTLQTPSDLVEPEPIYTEPAVEPLSESIKPESPKLAKLAITQTLPTPKLTSTYHLGLKPMFTQAIISLLMIVVYHFMFNSPHTPVSPANQGSVQGANTTSVTSDPRIDDLITKYKEHIAQEMQKDSKPPVYNTINLDNTSLLSGSGTLAKGKDQISVPSDKITPSTPVSITFNSDYAPAKKYWVTIEPGQFTLHTDFAVAAEANFNYSFVATTIYPANPVSTPSATLTTTKSSITR